MNETLIQNIYNFITNVDNYLKMEYNNIYHQTLVNNYEDFFDFIGSYYLGGSTVPDTSRYVVELMLMKNCNLNKE